MAFCARSGFERDHAVMTLAARFAFIHVIHGDMGGTFFHVKGLRMTFTAIEFLRMALV
jgi:hypothetical protein